MHANRRGVTSYDTAKLNTIHLFRPSREAEFLLISCLLVAGPEAEGHRNKHESK
jgi:hypothetical protein